MDNKISVFIVAGNRLLREALARMLKRDGIAVAGAAPQSADLQEQIATADCDVLLLDGTAQTAEDLEFIAQVRRTLPHVKIVVVGMEEEENLFLKTVRAGMVGYVLKDASAQDVAAAVRAVAQDAAICPPRLCLSLFRRVARERSDLPNIRVRIELGLTRREQQLVPLIAQGLTNKEIAAHFNLSEQTVKNHIHRMLQKVGGGDRLMIVERCRTQGLAL